MRVLVACERSGVVREAFRALGHDAWSCDLEPALDGSEFHIVGDALHTATDPTRGWDLMIAHPPCTDLAGSGAKHFRRKGMERIERAAQFFNNLMWVPVPRICLENPVGLTSTLVRPPNQIIQPWQFGDQAQKQTALWLINLPELTPTQIVERGEIHTTAGGKRIPQWYSRNTKSAHRARTFPGIARAMAQQWGRLCCASTF